MFSVYSLRLYFRLLYTSWQHVDRRQHYICLISFGSTRSEEEEEEEESEIFIYTSVQSTRLYTYCFSLSHTLFSAVIHLFFDFISSL